MKLVAFDGDHTLWEPLSGVNLSDRTPTDEEGWPYFTYRPVDGDPTLVQRDDGALFRLRPEAPEVLAALKARNVLTGVLSYNHEGNVRRILAAFGLSDMVDYVVAEWHTNKDQMLAKMLELARRQGHTVHPSDLVLVDDDPWEIYRGQCERMGAGFCRYGVDLHDLREVLHLLEASSQSGGAQA
jgi:magnesium-dependent phosphatase-1